MANLKKTLGRTAAWSGIAFGALITVATVSGIASRHESHNLSGGPFAAAASSASHTNILHSFDLAGLLHIESRRETGPSTSQPNLYDVAPAPPHPVSPLPPMSTQPDVQVASVQPSGFVATSTQPVSTFSIDVDTGSWPLLRKGLIQGSFQQFPRPEVRTEELVNYFRYDLPRPSSKTAPFAVTTDVGVTPWNPSTRIVRVALNAYDVPVARRPVANLVFLVDVSGSMDQPDKLPMVAKSLGLLASRMGPRDRVSIVTYAGDSRVVLEPTSDPDAVRAALKSLVAGGGTAGAGGIRAAYDLARRSFVEGGVNRIMLATDGDFNVGLSGVEEVKAMVAAQREKGITMSTLGFGSSSGGGDRLMEQVADVGNGNYSFIDSEQEARKVLVDEMAGTVFTVAHDVKVQVEFNPDSVSRYRLIGYENRRLAERDFADDAVDAGEIGSGHQVTALYEVVPAGSDRSARHFASNRGEGTAEAAFVKLRYKLPGSDRSILISHPVPSALLVSSRAPTGDFAFAVAVAAFGQTMSGDPELASFTAQDVVRLAGPQRDPLRREFMNLVPLGYVGMPVVEPSYDARRRALMQGQPQHPFLPAK